jgi:hypothetical protein
MTCVLLIYVARMRCRAFAPVTNLDTSRSMDLLQSGSVNLKRLVHNGSSNLGWRLLPRALPSSSMSRSSSSSMLFVFTGQSPALQRSASLWPSQQTRRMDQLQHVRCAASKASGKARTVYRCRECGEGEWHSRHSTTLPYWLFWRH